MLQKIKKYIPKPVKKILLLTYSRTILQWQKRRLYLQMQKNHQVLLGKIKNKDRIRVVFLAIHNCVWKVDPVFQKMLTDPFFDPIILVCPYLIYGEERMWGEMNECLEYFGQKGYPVQSSYNEKEGRWITLEELSTDIVFFTNPHDLTRKEYYEDAYLNYLSCYVPYFMLTTTHGYDQEIYNQFFHNSIWKIFMPHDFSMSNAERLSANKGKNLELTGYPACEDLLISSKEVRSTWKKQKNKKKKIIFSPHHTISGPGLRLSNFLLIAQIMIDLAKEHREKIQWSFKPHPLLRERLYAHPLWGVKKTDKYYDFWSDQDFCQYDNGEYADLFLESDALIHDCGSFIGEYLFVMKPCAYIIMSGAEHYNSINDFGRLALESHTMIKSINELEKFVISIGNGAAVNAKPGDFYERYISSLYLKGSPSDRILDAINIEFERELK